MLVGHRLPRAYGPFTRAVVVDSWFETPRSSSHILLASQGSHMVSRFTTRLHHAKKVRNTSQTISKQRTGNVARNNQTAVYRYCVCKVLYSVSHFYTVYNTTHAKIKKVGRKHYVQCIRSPQAQSLQEAGVSYGAQFSSMQKSGDTSYNRLQASKNVPCTLHDLR